MKTAFIQDIEKRLADIKAGVEAAHKQKTSWQQYNGTKQQELYNEQIAAGLKVADNKMFEIGFSIGQEIKKNQSEIAKKLYPEFNSSLSIERTRGESNRQFALDVVYKLPNVEAFTKLYNENIRQDNVDFCTWLIEAAELRFNSPTDKQSISEIKQRHVQELGLNETLIEKEQLLSMQGSFEQIKRNFAVGIYKPFSAATSLQEHTDMLTKAGLVS
jgi:hypothetical protein